MMWDKKLNLFQWNVKEIKNKQREYARKLDTKDDS